MRSSVPQHHYETIATELVKALRGRRSRPALSRRLGFRSNVLYNWETGRRWPDAVDLFRLATAVDVPVIERLSEFMGKSDWGPECERTDDPKFGAMFLDALRAGRSYAKISELSELSRYQVARMFKGETQPDLPTLLRLVHVLTLRLVDFVSLWVDIAKIPSLKGEAEKLEKTRTLAFTNPWTQAVLQVLELESYAALPAHDDQFVAKQLGISPTQVKQAIDALKDAEQIHHDGCRYLPIEAGTVDTRAHPEAGKKMRAWSAEVTRARLEEQQPGVYGYNLFSISEEDLQKVHKLYQSFFREVRNIIASSENPQRVVVANIHIVPLDGKPISTKS